MKEMFVKLEKDFDLMKEAMKTSREKTIRMSL